MSIRSYFISFFISFLINECQSQNIMQDTISVDFQELKYFCLVQNQNNFFYLIKNNDEFKNILNYSNQTLNPHCKNIPIIDFNKNSLLNITWVERKGKVINKDFSFKKIPNEKKYIFEIKMMLIPKYSTPLGPTPYNLWFLIPKVKDDCKFKVDTIYKPITPYEKH